MRVAITTTLVARVPRAVQRRSLDVIVARPIIDRPNRERFPIIGPKTHDRKQRAGDQVACGAHLERVEPKRTEEVPRRHLAVVLIAEIALPAVRADEQSAKAVTNDLLGSVRLPCEHPHVGDVVRGLVGQPEQRTQWIRPRSR